MSSEATTDLALLGIILFGCGFVVRYLRPDFHAIWPLLSLLGGGMCMLFALMGHRGPRWCRLGARVTLVVMVGALASQTILNWESSDVRQARSFRLPVMAAVLTVFCLGTYLRIGRDR